MADRMAGPIDCKRECEYLGQHEVTRVRTRRGREKSSYHRRCNVIGSKETTYIRHDYLWRK